MALLQQEQNGWHLKKKGRHFGLRNKRKIDYESVRKIGGKGTSRF